MEHLIAISAHHLIPDQVIKLQSAVDARTGEVVDEESSVIVVVVNVGVSVSGFIRVDD